MRNLYRMHVERTGDVNEYRKRVEVASMDLDALKRKGKTFWIIIITIKNPLTTNNGYTSNTGFLVFKYLIVTTQKI